MPALAIRLPNSLRTASRTFCACSPRADGLRGLDVGQDAAQESVEGGEVLGGQGIRDEATAQRDEVLDGVVVQGMAPGGQGDPDLGAVAGLDAAFEIAGVLQS